MKPLTDIIFGLEGFEATAFWIGLFVTYMIVGFFLDYLMQRQGFGPYWNGALALLGTFLGLYVRYNYLKDHELYRWEPLLTMGCVTGGIAVFMVVLAFVRNRTS